MIESYIKAFARLRSAAGADRWDAATNHRAPNKPFLLLSVLDLIAQQQIKVNFIELNTDLLEVFDLYWTKIMGQDREGNAAMPFFHLRSEGFWHLIPIPGKEELLQTTRQIRSLRDVQAIVLGARFDDVLFDLLRTAEYRDQLRRILIEQYFAPDTRPLLIEAGDIANDAFVYSRELLNHARGKFKIEEVPAVNEQYLTESRSVGFRRVIVHAYNHTCAVCGIRLLTPEGRTAVAAAHIIPWSRSHNDDPRNGLALCGLHHWCFDQGLFTVMATYDIAISTAVPNDDDATMPFRALAGRTIRLPTDDYLRPASDALRWHTMNVFRSDGLRRLF